MSFLGITFLAALPLVAAPLLLHLFDRRRNVVIEWGAMQFLSEASTRRSSARKFQHWLLLLLRTLAIAALVLALAQPLVPAGWLGGTDRTETILVIDNSMSTQQRSEEGLIFDRLIAKAEQSIQDLESNSTVRILLTSPYPAWVTPASLRVDTATRSQVIDLLHDLRPTAGTSDVPAALLKAVQSEVDDKQLTSRRVLLLTDGQRKDWRTEDTAGWERFRELLGKSLIPTSIEIFDDVDQGGKPGNLAVARIRANRTVVGVNQPFALTAEIHSHSSEASAARPLTWFIGQEKHSEVQLPSLEPGATHDVLLTHSFSKPGIYSLGCRLSAGDELEADDRESIVVEAVERVPVLLVESSDGFAEIQQDAYLVRAALGRIEGDESENWRAVFEPRTVPPEQLDNLDLQDFRVVVIPNVTELTNRATQRLTDFVSNGGGLWLALGPRTDIDSFNKQVFNHGSGVAPVPLARIVDESSDRLLQPTINPFLKGHPATAELADNDRLDTGDVKVSRRFRFQMPPEPHNVSVLLDLSNGEPLVVENRVGSGRVVVQAIPLRFQWSDLAVSHAFVVMVHNWLGFLAEPGSTRHNLSPGDPISLQITGMSDPHATMTMPDGEDVALVGEPTADGISFRTSRTALPGNYTLDVGVGRSSIPFHVGRDGGESDLTRLTAHDRTFLDEAVGLHQGRVTTPTLATHARTPLWPALLGMLIVVIAAELVLSGLIARKRFGAPPISDTTAQLTTEPPIPLGMSLGRRGSRRTGSGKPDPEEATV